MKYPSIAADPIGWRRPAEKPRQGNGEQACESHKVVADAPMTEAAFTTLTQTGKAGRWSGLNGAERFDVLARWGGPGKFRLFYLRVHD